MCFKMGMKDSPGIGCHGLNSTLGTMTASRHLLETKPHSRAEQPTVGADLPLAISSFLSLPQPGFARARLDNTCKFQLAMESAKELLFTKEVADRRSYCSPNFGASGIFIAAWRTLLWPEAVPEYQDPRSSN